VCRAARLASEGGEIPGGETTRLDALWVQFGGLGPLGRSGLAALSLFTLLLYGLRSSGTCVFHFHQRH
jgi:hypothetical protein